MTEATLSLTKAGEHLQLGPHNIVLPDIEVLGEYQVSRET